MGFGAVEPEADTGFGAGFGMGVGLDVGTGFCTAAEVDGRGSVEAEDVDRGAFWEPGVGVREMDGFGEGMDAVKEDGTGAAGANAVDGVGKGCTFGGLSDCEDFLGLGPLVGVAFVTEGTGVAFGVCTGVPAGAGGGSCFGTLAERIGPGFSEVGVGWAEALGVLTVILSLSDGVEDDGAGGGGGYSGATGGATNGVEDGGINCPKGATGACGSSEGGGSAGVSGTGNALALVRYRSEW